MLRRLLVAVCLLGAACGGSKQDSSGLSYSIEQTADAAVATYGDHGAAKAVLLAADKGYTIQQIMAAAVEKRLGPDGQIQGKLGTSEAPAGKATNRLTFAGGGDLPARAAGGSFGGRRLLALEVADFVIEQMQKGPTIGDWHYKDGTKSTIAIVGLLIAGYTVDEIVEGTILGHSFIAIGGGIYFAGDKTILCPDERIAFRRCPDDNELLKARGLFTPTVVAAAVAPAATVAAPAAQPARGNEICVDGTSNYPTAGLTIEVNKFSLCFPRAGGALSGKYELTFTTQDDDCRGRISAVVTLAGTYAGSGVSGGAQGSVTITFLSGECKNERELLTAGTTNTNLPAWEGSFDGTTLRIRLAVDPEDPTDVVVLEGRPR